MSMRTPSFGQRVRHLARGSSYMVLGRQKIQISPETLERAISKNPMFGSTLEQVCHVLEGMTFITYCADADNAKWARPESEFVDGRFEEIPPPPSNLKMPSEGF
jgi:hypothetical protein